MLARINCGAKDVRIQALDVEGQALLAHLMERADDACVTMDRKPSMVLSIAWSQENG